MNHKGNSLSSQTERTIRDTFLQLLEQKPPEKISVSDLCAGAGINRSTFYRHYLDIYDLMEHVEAAIWRDFAGSFASAGCAERFSIEAVSESREVLAAMLRHVQRYAVFYRSYLRGHSDTLGEPGFQKIWEERLVPMFRARGVTKENHMRYYYRYAEAGCRTTVRCWLEAGCPESVEEMADILWRVRYVAPGEKEKIHEEPVL